jgi:hypothetical protein
MAASEWWARQQATTYLKAHYSRATFSTYTYIILKFNRGRLEIYCEEEENLPRHRTLGEAK